VLAVFPDSRWIVFAEDRRTLKKVAVGGGSAITLAQLPGTVRGATWIDDTALVVGTTDPTKGLLRVPASGGEPVILTTPDAARGEQGHWSPSVLPGGGAVLFTIRAVQPQDSQIAVLDLASHRQTIFFRGGNDPFYVASGHLVFVAAGGLAAVRFDLNRRAVAGDPVRVVEGVALVADGGTNATVTRNGTLVFAPGSAAGATPRSLVWVDRQGRETPIPAPLRTYLVARLSPDGTRVLVSTSDHEIDVWVWELARQTLTRLTSDPAADAAPAWSADGRYVLFSSERAGVYNLYARSADGSGKDMRLTNSPNVQAISSVTPDGKYALGYEIRPSAGRDVVRLPLDGLAGGRLNARATEGLIETRFDEGNPQISPDGRFLAYQSDESGQLEVYVRPYPQLTARHQVSTNGGTRPAWSRGGRELVYLNKDDHITAVPIEATGSTLRAGEPVELFATTYPVTVPNRTYDVTPDGQRFLMIRHGAAGAPSPPPASLTVVQNWTEELSRRVP
jgi:serine/threonine-protein kinase